MDYKKYFLLAFDEVGHRFHLSQADLAEALSTSSPTISNMRQGKRNLRPQLEWLTTLISKYGVNPAYLLTGKGEVFEGSKDPTLKQLLKELKSLRELNEKALTPLIDGYLEIKTTKAKKNLFNPSKS